MGITSIADYQSSLRQTIIYRKSGTSWGNSSTYYSNVQITGNPAAAAAPGNSANGIVPTSPATGYPSIYPFTGDAYVTQIEAALLSSQSAFGGFRYLLADLLFYAGTYTLASNVTLSSQPSYLSRLPNGSYRGTQIWIEQVPGTGSTSPAPFTIGYTNAAGTTGRSVTIDPYTGSNVGLAAVQVPLQSGDDGVQKIDSVVGGGGGGSFSANVMVLRPLAYGRVNWTKAKGVSRQWLDRACMPQVFSNSALVTLVQCEGSGNGSVLSTAPLELAIEIAAYPIDFSVHSGTLVAELLFEDGAGSATAANTGSVGGTFSIGGSLTPSIVATGGHDGAGYLQFQDAGTSDNHGGANDGHPSQFIIGTADFEISVYAQFVRYDTAWGQAFWGWEYGNPSPRLFCEDVTGKLQFVDGTIAYYTGFTCPIDSTWRKYTLRRISGVAYVLVDDTVVFSVPYGSDCNVGFNNGSFRVGVDGNLAAGQCGKFDDFRFYNSNV